MTTVTLEGPVADTLTAVAAVDNTPPDQLAQMIVADWLATHHHRFRRAARALDRLFPTHPLQPLEDVMRDAADAVTGMLDDLVDESPASINDLARVAAEHAVEHRDEMATSGFPPLPEDPETGSDDPTGDDDPDPEPTGQHVCDRCGRDDFKSAAGLGGHRPHCKGPRAPVDLHTCVVCRSRVPTVRKVAGIGDCCRACAKAAA